MRSCARSTRMYMECLEARLAMAGDVAGLAGDSAMLLDLNTTRASFQPTGSVTFQDEVFFLADDGENETELWRTDGTPDGTAIVLAFPVGENYCGTCPTDMVVAGDHFYFSVSFPNSVQLWKSDGTTSGTEVVKQVGEYQTDMLGTHVRLHEHDDGILLQVTEWQQSDEDAHLWYSDGTADGTEVYSPRFSWSFNSAIERLVELDDRWYFLGRTGIPETVLGLWATDPTTRETTLVRQFDVDDPWFSPGMRGLRVEDGMLVFSADDGDGLVTWQSDGTAEGTVLAPQRDPGTRLWPQIPELLGSVGGQEIYSIAAGLSNDPQNEPFFSMDGSSQGSNPHELTAVGDQLFYFTSTSPNRTSSLERLAALTSETIALDVTFRHEWLSIAPPIGWNPIAMEPIDDAVAVITPGEIWTERMGPLQIDVGFSGARVAAVTGAEQVFVAFATEADNWDGHEYGVWVSDATGDWQQFHFENEWFSAMNYGGEHLFVVTGEENSLQAIAVYDDNIVELGIDGVGQSVPTNDGLFFLRHTNEQTEVWHSNATVDGTRRVATIESSSTNSNATLVEYGDGLVVAPGDGSLWQVDPEAGTMLLIKRFSDTSRLDELVVADGKLFFTADDGVVGNELWTSDGTSAGTRLAADIREGFLASNPIDLELLGDRLYFAADDGRDGQELWSIRTDFAIPDIVGDLDEDNTVSFADFLLLSDSFGKQVVAGEDAGDLDGNGLVDFGDFLILSRNFGNSG